MSKLIKIASRVVLGAAVLAVAGIGVSLAGAHYGYSNYYPYQQVANSPYVHYVQTQAQQYGQYYQSHYHNGQHVNYSNNQQPYHYNNHQQYYHNNQYVSPYTHYNTPYNYYNQYASPYTYYNGQSSVLGIQTTVPKSDGIVNIVGNSYSPSTVTIRFGQRVIWRNNDTVPHTATNSQWFDSGVINPGGQYKSEKFTLSGDFSYYDKITGIHGVVHVLPY